MEPSSKICQNTFENPWNLLDPATLHAPRSNQNHVLKRLHNLQFTQQDKLDEKKQQRKSRE